MPGAIFGHVGVSLFVASALFGDVGKTVSQVMCSPSVCAS